jgi:4-hydroxybenzoate polyprenyltransferase
LLLIIFCNSQHACGKGRMMRCEEFYPLHMSDQLANESGSASLIHLLKVAASDIKLSHSIFAMPFAILGAFVARMPDAPWGEFAIQLALAVVCMVAARTWAMLINRVADHTFDAANPRTAQRAIASGRLKAGHGWMMAILAALMFVGTCAGFWFAFGNPWPVYLALPVLGWLALYSYAKRFTALCHVLLGSALAISPIAAGLAIEPTRAITPTSLLLAGFVTCWVAGFDILYALADEGFDRSQGLHSVPAKLGTKGAVWVSRALHLVAGGVFGLVALTGLGDSRFGMVMVGAWVIVAALLIVEHVVLTRRGLAGLPMVFFTINGIVSLVIGTLGVLDLLTTRG